MYILDINIKGNNQLTNGCVIARIDNVEDYATDSLNLPLGAWNVTAEELLYNVPVLSINSGTITINGIHMSAAHEIWVCGQAIWCN